MSDDNPAPPSAAARLFDIRLMIGGLFVVYGVILTIAGLVTSQAEVDKAAGINMNLWLGIGMLVLGVLFLIWMRVNPNQAEPNPTEPNPTVRAPGDRPTH